MDPNICPAIRRCKELTPLSLPEKIPCRAASCCFRSSTCTIGEVIKCGFAVQVDIMSREEILNILSSEQYKRIRSIKRKIRFIFDKLKVRTAEGDFHATLETFVTIILYRQRVFWGKFIVPNL